MQNVALCKADVNKQRLQITLCTLGLCSWIQEVDDDFSWTLSAGLDVEQPWDGPQYDHTLGNNEGTGRTHLQWLTTAFGRSQFMADKQLLKQFSSTS